MRKDENNVTINADYISDLPMTRASAFETGNFGADVLSGIRQIETKYERVLKPNERGLIMEGVVIKCTSSDDSLKFLLIAIQPQSTSRDEPAKTVTATLERCARQVTQGSPSLRS